MTEKVGKDKENLSSINRVIFKYLPEVLLILCVGFTFYVAGVSKNRTERANHNSFSTIQESIVNTIETRFRFYENTLQQTKAFFMQGKKISSQDFKVYVNNVGLIQRYPGMTAIAYAEYVPAEKVDEFVKNMRAQGQVGYRVWPKEENRAFYTPVKFIEPFFKIIKELRGFDLVSNRERRETMLKSTRDGQPTVTEEVNLFIKNISSRGFNIFVPVYNAFSDPITEAERVQNTQGYVIGIFSAQHLFNTILNENEQFNELAGFKIFLKENNGLDLVYDSTTGIKEKVVDEPRFKQRKQIKIANKDWTIEVQSLLPLENNLENESSWLIIFLGLIASFLIWFLSHNIRRNRVDLIQREKKFRKIAKSNQLLLEAAKTLGTSLETGTILKRFSVFLTQNFCECCVIQIAEEGKKRGLAPLTRTFQEGSGEECIGLMKYFINETSYSQEVHSRGKLVHVYSTDEFKGRSLLGLPIILENKPFGVLSLFFREDRVLSEEDIRLFEQAVKIATLSIENSLLYHEIDSSNKLKDEFLATVSHELRSPLMVIMGYSRLLLNRNFPADVKKYIKAIGNSAEHQRILIEDLLEVSGISSGKIKFHPQVIHMQAVIQSAAETIALEAKNKHIRLMVDIKQDCMVLGEEFRLHQILNNLLSNSLKFTEEGGLIEVTAMKEKKYCKITVRDTGKGIDPDFLPHVFDKFRQEEKTSTRAKGGLGLGLSIVLSLVNLHNGRITVDSAGRGKGCTFTLYFPIVDGKEENEVDSETHDMDLKDIKVLVIEDDKDLQEELKKFLLDHHAETKFAFSEQEALNFLKDKNIDLIISDTDMLSKSTGHFLSEVIKTEKDLGRHLPKIGLTQTTSCPDESEEEKYDVCLNKPFNAMKLAREIRKVLPF